MTRDEIKIREITTVKDLAECVRLQKSVFGLPDAEISPVRHLIVTKNAGGFTLAAFAGEKIVGFVLSVAMFAGADRAFYSHMMAVDAKFQNHGIGAKLKWAQRQTSLSLNVKIIKWTFQPVQARNAYFNLEKLGVEIKEYKPNFYGTDYSTAHETGGNAGLDSDRLFAEWNLENAKVTALAKGEKYSEKNELARTIEIFDNWNDLVETAAPKAAAEQTRIKHEFQIAFAENLICKGFERRENTPRYLLYKN